MPRKKQVGNPLAAAIVGVIIAGMGVYLILRSDSDGPRLFGILVVVFGAVGAVANLWLRRRLGNADRRDR